jgi:hypothetical protein
MFEQTRSSTRTKMNTRTIAFTVGITMALGIATAETVTVSPMNMHGWAFIDDNTNAPCVAPSCEMVNGPATPPAGTGSAHFVITSTSQGNFLGAAIRQGTRLDHITKLTYSTYEASAVGPLAVSLQFPIDFDLTDTNTTYQGRMVYEPYNNGTVVLNLWQSWDAIDGGLGRWWFTKAPGNVTCGQATPCTWAQILHTYPNIGIHNTLGGVVLKAGSGWVSFNGNTDKLTLGVLGAEDTTYDFELGPTDKESCKNGGWVGFFKNQGQCVSSFAHDND